MQQVTHHTPSSFTKTTNSISVGIIGLGRMGNYHASVTTQITDARLYAVADTSLAHLEKVTAPDVIKTTDYREWIDQVDAVIIAVPTEYHYALAKDCLLREKHVLLEKPLTKTIAQAEELYELAYEKNCTLHVGHVERFNGAVQELAATVKDPFLIESHRMGPFAPRVQQDSVVLDLMIHDLDIVLNLINEPVKNIYAVGRSIYSSTIDVATVQLEFANEVCASIMSSRASQIKQRTMAIHQKDDYIHLDFMTQDIAIHKRATSSVQVGSDQLKYKQETTVEHLFVHKENPLKLEVEHFIHAIKTNTARCCPEKDLIALRITLEIEKKLGLW